MNERKTAAEVRKSLSAAEQEQIRHWCRADDRDPVIRRANVVTQLKTLGVYVVFALTLAAYLASGGHWAVTLASVAVLGGICLPLLCSYMHSHSHWKVGNGPVRNWLLDHWISLLYSVPQTGYDYGHVAHHRYDNDFDSRGLPKDLQSTYVFSTDGRPSNIWKWCAFNVVVYNHAIILFHVLNASRRYALAWYVLEYLSILGFHAGLCWLSPGYYLSVYLPSLLLGWTVVAINLYMMHAVDMDHFQVHPSLNSRNRLYNTFAENVGYHLEHSLYPGLHGVYLQQASDVIKPPPEQVIEHQYLTEALRRLFRTRHKRSQVV